jgi:hypothetical protein
MTQQSIPDFRGGDEAGAGASCWRRFSCPRISGLCCGTRRDLISKSRGALVRIGGPLRPFAGCFLADLVEQGDALRTVQFELPIRQMRLELLGARRCIRASLLLVPGLHPLTDAC